MKGVIFTELLGMIEARFAPGTVDKIIAQSTLPSDRSYSSAGTYPPEELFELVGLLSQESGMAVPELLKRYGEYLFGRFVEVYPQHFQAPANSFQFLATLNDKIHPEVRKLYPDAELPWFDSTFPSPDRMLLYYRSSRPLADLAEGLIRGCSSYFGEEISIERETMSHTPQTFVRFILTRRKSA